jgi:hypothetical protein
MDARRCYYTASPAVSRRLQPKVQLELPQQDVQGVPNVRLGGIKEQQ